MKASASVRVEAVRARAERLDDQPGRPDRPRTRSRRAHPRRPSGAWTTSRPSLLGGVDGDFGPARPGVRGELGLRSAAHPRVRGRLRDHLAVGVAADLDCDAGPCLTTRRAGASRSRRLGVTSEATSRSRETSTARKPAPPTLPRPEPRAPGSCRSSIPACEEHDHDPVLVQGSERPRSGSAGANGSSAHRSAPSRLTMRAISTASFCVLRAIWRTLGAVGRSNRVEHGLGVLHALGREGPQRLDAGLLTLGRAGRGEILSRSRYTSR